MSNSKLSVHVRVYRGKDLTYNAKGESTNENHIVKLEYNTAEYKRFLSMLRANGFIKAEVEKVLDLSKVVTGKLKNEKGYYEEVEDFKDIQKQFYLSLNPEGVEKPLTADQQKIADLEAKIDILMGGKEPKEEINDEEKEALKLARDAYFKVFDKKGHHSWSVEEINQKIADFKPE